MADLRRYVKGACLLGALGCLLTIISESSAPAGGVAYKYVEKNGTVNYTEQWDLIPPAYRGQVLILDVDTLKPREPASGSTSPAPRHNPGHAEGTNRLKRSFSLFADWWNRGIRELSGLSVPLPTSFRLGVALTAFALIAGIMIILQMTASPFGKTLLRSVIVLMLGLTAYAMFFSSLNEQIAAITGDRPDPSVTGREGIGAVHEQADRITTSNERLNPFASFNQSAQETIHTPHTPLTKAKRAAQQMERATLRLEQTIAEYEPDSRAATSGTAGPLPQAAAP